MNAGEKKKQIRIRPMRREDLQDVLLIERASFPSPWPERLFLRELANPISDLFVAFAPGLAGDRVLGYTVCWLVVEEVHVQNVAAHPNFRRHGIASALLDFVLSYYLPQKAQSIYLEVREHNLPARKLYRKFHFRPVGFRKRYYCDTGENAIVMQRAISMDMTHSATE